MGDVVNLNDARPHSEGEAFCLDCKHQWVAVAPSGVVWMECPACHLMRGRFKFHHMHYDKPHWECGCGNELFCILPDFVYCPNCGKRQDGFHA
jgi:hypothetical protein